MTLADVKRAVEDLSADERRELAAYLACRNWLSDPKELERIAADLDDRSPEKWIPLRDPRHD